jgi:hypothetical protein
MARIRISDRSVVDLKVKQSVEELKNKIKNADDDGLRYIEVTDSQSSGGIFLVFIDKIIYIY